MDNSFLSHLHKQGDKIIVVMRGLPGSGKSFEAKKIAKELGVDPNTHILSTDNYFIPDTLEMRKLGLDVPSEHEVEEYRKNWHFSKLGDAHTTTQNKAKEMIDQGISPIIIDNTNIKKSEIKLYTDYAKLNGYHIVVRESSSDWWKEYSPHLLDKNPEKLEKFADILNQRNSHGVPLQTIKTMMNKWEKVDVAKL